jgi:hypothetical protein
MLKHVPTEILGAYLAVAGLLATIDAGTALTVAQWVNFGLFLVATPLWMIFVSRVTSIWQNVLSTVAFLIWVMTIVGGPFAFMPPAIGSASVIVFSAVIAPVVASAFARKTPPQR